MLNNNSKILVSADMKDMNELDFLATLRGSSYDWHEHEAEGQLAVDISQTNEELVVVAPMAGTPPEKVGLHLQNDLLTIRGERISPAHYNTKHYHQEVYWGKFSRTVVLPCEVNYELAKAEYRNGVLLIRLPKRRIGEEIKITVIDE